MHSFTVYMILRRDLVATLFLVSAVQEIISIPISAAMAVDSEASLSGHR